MYIYVSIWPRVHMPTRAHENFFIIATEPKIPWKSEEQNQTLVIVVPSNMDFYLNFIYTDIVAEVSDTKKNRIR